MGSRRRSSVYLAEEDVEGLQGQSAPAEALATLALEEGAREERRVHWVEPGNTARNRPPPCCWYTCTHSEV